MPQEPHQTGSDEPAELLLQRARAVEVSRAGVEGLTQLVENEPEAIHAALARALERFEGATAAVLVMAGLRAGLHLDVDETWPVLSILPDIHWLPLIVGATGPAMMPVLLKALGSGRLSNEREAVSCLLATEVAGKEGLPPLVLIKLRTLAQKRLSPSAGLAVGLAAMAAQDPDARKEAVHWIALASLPPGTAMLSGVRSLLKGEFPEVIPTRVGRARVGEGPVRNEGPTVGRNDPCPCGSGKKYKRCCANVPSAGSGSEGRLPTASDLDRSSSTRPSELSAYELCRLDYRKLGTRDLIDTVRGLTNYQYWEHAERAMEELARRKDLPMEEVPCGYRQELVQAAMRAKAIDVALRQHSKLKDPQILESVRLEMALLERAPGALELLQAQAKRVLEGDPMAACDLAYPLLTQVPALGILVARSAVLSGMPWDSECLLGEIEKARIELGLPADDPATELYEQMLEKSGDKRAAESSKTELADLKFKLVEKADAVSALEKKLAEQQKRLDGLQAERAEQTSRGEMPEPERVDLRQKISQMKALIAEGQKERAELRRRLADASRPSESEAATKAREADGEDLTELDLGTPAWEKVLVPVFGPKAAATLPAAGPALAGRAIRLAAELATGDAAAWTGVKRLKGRTDIWSVRVGIHHRLLFRMEPARSELEVVALIQRRDLDATLKQL